MRRNRTHTRRSAKKAPEKIPPLAIPLDFENCEDLEDLMANENTNEYCMKIPKHLLISGLICLALQHISQLIYRVDN